MSNIEYDEVQTNSSHNGGKTIEFEDAPIKCIDCLEEFTWTAGEQEFFHDKNLLNPPKRCKECKKAKNRRIEAIEASKATGSRHRIEVAAECAGCSVMTTVPFYPSQGRPVYCRACYIANNSKATNGSSGTN